MRCRCAGTRAGQRSSPAGGRRERWGQSAGRRRRRRRRTGRPGHVRWRRRTAPPTTVRRVPSRSPGRTVRGRATRAVRSRAARCPPRAGGRATRRCGRRSSAARPSDSSSAISSFGASTNTRAIASMRCSPPDSVPATWARRSASRGNSSKASSRPALTPWRPRIRLIDRTRFSSTVSVPNTERPSGAWATPRASELVRRLAGHVDAVDADRAGRSGRSARRRHGRSWSCRHRSVRRARPLRRLRS